jgi:hypothetical protein
MGNYDQGVGHSSDDCGCAYTNPVSEALGKRSIAWTNAQTTDDHKAYLRALPAHLPLQIGDYRVLLVHGMGGAEKLRPAAELKSKPKDNYAFRSSRAWLHRSFAFCHHRRAAGRIHRFALDQDQCTTRPGFSTCERTQEMGGLVAVGED